MPTIASTHLTRKEAISLSGAPETVVNKAIEQRVVPMRRLKSGSFIDPIDVGALALFSQLARFSLPVAQKKLLRAWLRSASQPEWPLSSVLIVRKTKEIDEAIGRALRYTELRERYLEVDPGIRGGEPVIRGTRIPIRGIAKQFAAGEDPSVLAEDYPNVPPEALEFALQWAAANPRRGRPAPAWRDRSDDSEPAQRATRIQSRKRRAAKASALQ